MDQIIVAILGILAAAYAYHLLQKIRSTKEFFIKAIPEFRRPFDEVKMIFDLNTKGLHKKTDIGETFILYFSEQKMAVATFEQVLPRRFIKRMRDAWIDYENYINNESISKWFDSDNLFKLDDETIEKRKTAIVKIGKILWFSDYHNIYSAIQRFHKKV